MTSATIWALVFLCGVLVLFSVLMYAIFRSVRKTVELELDKYKDDEEMQAKIRKQVVKAVFPPRFPKD